MKGWVDGGGSKSIYENEDNSFQSRVGIYVRNNIRYIRRKNAEGNNNQLVVVNLIGAKFLG